MSGYYKTDLAARQTDEDHWELLSPLVYLSDLVGQVQVPAGFVTDFATVPRVPFIYARFGRRGDKAAVIHDFLYRTKELHGQKLSRAMVDDVYREALRAIPVKWSTAFFMWLGVRACGWWYYYPQFDFKKERKK